MVVVGGGGGKWWMQQLKLQHAAASGCACPHLQRVEVPALARHEVVELVYVQGAAGGAEGHHAHVGLAHDLRPRQWCGMSSAAASWQARGLRWHQEPTG
jgi:hypothetical protein